MASKTTLNAKNLEPLGAARLADLLIEISTGSAVAKRRLRLELAGAQSPKEAAREVAKRLTSIAPGFLRALRPSQFQPQPPLGHSRAGADLDQQFGQTLGTQRLEVLCVQGRLRCHWKSGSIRSHPSSGSPRAKRRH